MNRSTIILIGVAVAALVIFGETTYTVSEVEQVIITQLGEPVGDPVVTPGLHFKLPFIQRANVFDKRFLEWDGSPNQVPTRDKRFIWVDTYARWHITDPLLFFQRLRDERGAQSRLDDILDGESARIRGERERDLAQIQSEAYRQAEELRGEADAEATRIYAEAYNRDPAFDAFTKSLETYEETMDSSTIFMLGTDTELLRFLEQPR